MKINTKKQISKAFLIRNTLMGVLLGATLSSGAQVANKGNMYIADNADMYIGSSAYYFESGGSSATSRTAALHGALSFSAATFNGASDSHFIDGYARAIGSTATLFPVGQTAVYAPVKVAPSASATVNAAYFRAAPSTIGSTLDAGVTAISTVEYWGVVSSSNAVITLTWRASSNLAALSQNSLSNITIAGWNGTAWVDLSATVDATSVLGGSSTLTAGSVTTDAAIAPGAYTVYTLGIKGGCSTLVASSGNIKTWNGSWTPSAPGLTDPAVINTAFSGTLECNSLTLNANITLANGQYLDVVNGVTGTGKVIMSTQASIVQHNPASPGPAIELIKTSPPLRRYDYMALSSPITVGQDFFNLLRNKDNVATESTVLPGTGAYGTQPMSAIGTIKELNPQGTLHTNATTATVGKGLIAYVKNQAPYSLSTSPGSWNDQYKTLYMKITGTANNGDVPVTVPASYNAIIGNPYPSAIDGQKLLDAAGAHVRKTLYYWSHATPISAAGTYNQTGDYATWTEAGGTAATGSAIVPTSKIGSMQSVYLQALDANATTFNITNCMRLTGDNTQFFRTTASKDRFWLNLTGSGVVPTQSQILLAYLPDATYGDDIRYDAKRLDGTTYSYLSSVIDDKNFVIQARPTFDDTDIVPLSIYKAALNETFTISLGNKEGVFDAGQVIYLYDASLNVYHDLASGGYSFVQNAGMDANRFKVVYRNNALSIGEVVSNKVLAFIDNQVFTASSSLRMSDIQIFDMRGRQIAQFNADGQKSFAVPFVHAMAPYIAKIRLENGTYATVKLINNK